MKKNKGLYRSLLLSAILLAACNTESDEVIKTSASPEPIQSEVQPVEPPKEAQPQEEVVAQAPPAETVAPTATTTIEVPMITSTSPTLNYIIQHPDTFTLTSEEPGKDMLFYNENDALSMRIEVFATTDASFEDINKLTQEATAAIAPNNTYEGFNLATYVANRSDIINSASYRVKYESDQVISILYEVSDKIIALTIFDDYITGLTDTFIKAGLTVQ